MVGLVITPPRPQGHRRRVTMPVTVGPTSPAKRGPYMTKKRRRMLEASAEVTPVAKHTGSLTTIHMAPTVTVQSIRTAPNEKHVPVPLRTYTCGLPEPPIDAAQDAVGSCRVLRSQQRTSRRGTWIYYSTATITSLSRSS